MVMTTPQLKSNRGLGAKSSRRLFLLMLMCILLTMSSSSPGFAYAQDDDDDEDAAPVNKIKNPTRKAAPTQQYGKGNVAEDLIRSKDDIELLPKQIDIGVEVVDFGADLTNSTTPLLRIDSIEPAHGPTTGETRVLVRGGPFGKWALKYPTPLCKFGDHDGAVVRATYVTCTAEPGSIFEKEARRKQRTYTCLQCDNVVGVSSPQTVQVKVSLTGTFDDNINSVPYEFYPPTKVHAFYPRYGPKDGDTLVKVWGENFIDYGQDTKCSFGTKVSNLKIYNSTYAECNSTQSDVVEKPIPFTISLNNQQQSRDILWYYYYNWPAIIELDPNRGPVDGGNIITLKGRNFFPFKEILSEIDNRNDTFCIFMDLEKKKIVEANVLNSTRVECRAPASYYYTWSRLEITLNGVEFTEDEVIYRWYKPPVVLDISPREGPVKGGTIVIIEGTNFQNTENIRCSFGGHEVQGRFISLLEIECISPEVEKPGYVDLAIAFGNDDWSKPVQYLYYDFPKIYSIDPPCGPEGGYTQIAVIGANFMDLGRNKALCYFNQTVKTNATVMSDELMYCDSPAILDDLGYSLLKGDDLKFYNLQVSIDGGNVISGTPQQFNYYQQAVVQNVVPNKGPISGNTPISIKTKGIGQPGVCNIRVRLGTYDFVPEILDNQELLIKNDQVKYPGLLAVQVTFNNQQYSAEKVVHKRDPTATYKYYQDPIITFHSPVTGPSVGGTRIKIFGYGFAPNEGKRQADKNSGNYLWVRYVDPEDLNKILAGPFLVDEDKYDNEAVNLLSPPQPAGTKSIIQISLNSANWLIVKAPHAHVSFSWYESPHVTHLNPSFGPVKNTQPLTMTIEGENFECFSPPCDNVQVRFGTEPNNAIYVEGRLTSSGTIQCEVPYYTKPDILPVEVSINGVDFSNDNRTFGYFDPYVIDVQPRLIAIDGSTKVTLTGLGFVNSGETKSQFHAIERIKCGESGCNRPATFIDKNHITSDTLPQSQMIVQQTGKSIMWDEFYIEASVYSDQFTNNRIPVFYYEEAQYEKFYAETPANIQLELFIKAKLSTRDLQRVIKYGNPKVRFRASDGTEIIVDAILLHLPMIEGHDEKDYVEPNTIKVRTPIWTLKEGLMKQVVKLDIALNGQNFVGDFDFTFTEPLILHRTVPMSGPLQGDTNTLLIGQGFRAIDPKINYDAKWGTIMTQVLPRKSVSDYFWEKQAFENIIPGNEEIKAYLYEALSYPRVDTNMTESITYSQIYRPSNRLLKQIPVNGNAEYVTGEGGGPWYVEVGREMEIPTQSTIMFKANQTTEMDYIYHEFNPSHVEFFQYIQPTFKFKHPDQGVSEGGTLVEVVGFDFRYKPEYGVVPHCKFGDKIVRAWYDSTVRIVCRSPPSDTVGVPLPFTVSLNGVDWLEMDQTFSYYIQPDLYTAVPDAGPSSGGTEIYFTGKNFPQMDNPELFKCRFTPTNSKSPPRNMPGIWLNDTTIMCTTPGGWNEGDKMSLQVTFNGIDYDKSGFKFIFYRIADVVPRSGPSDGSGGDILVQGQGFRPEVRPRCLLNGTEYEPISVNWTEIRCPIVPAQDGPDYFGNVDLAISVNGQTWEYQDGGFQYYKNPTVLDIYPRNGPAQGVGIINFYGSGFRSDFPLAKLGCKIGNTIGEAVLVSDQQMRCVVDDLETVPEGERLTAQVALNSYSWSTPNDDIDETGYTYYVPYTIQTIFPSSGPLLGGTEILVQGRGFTPQGNDIPRCRFGTPANYIIVEADVLSYYRVMCRTPEDTFKNDTFSYMPADLPFSVALTADSYEPWTQTSHKFRFYRQPSITKIEPMKVEVGKIVEVTVTIDKEDVDENEKTTQENIFFEPVPVNKIQPEDDEDDNTAFQMGSFVMIKCSFGRFGETPAVFYNETTIKCLTPSVPDDPDDIYAEEVDFLVTMNGFDYDDDNSDQQFFLFEGTGTPMKLLPVVLFIIVIGFFIVGSFKYLQQLCQDCLQDAGPNVR